MNTVTTAHDAQAPDADLVQDNDTAPATDAAALVEPPPAAPADLGKPGPWVPPDAPPTARSSRWSLWLNVGLSVLLMFAVAASVLLGWKLHDRDAVVRADVAGGQALAVAKQYAVTLTSIDADHFDQDVAAVQAGATGDFKNMFADAAKKLEPDVLQGKGASKGQVVAASVQSATPTQVVVMLFVDQAITNVTNPTPRVDRSRMTMTLDKVGDTWLASKVDLT